MATEGEVWVQLATRIPKQLHRELKLYCVKSDVSVMDFVVSALQDKLSRDARGRSGQRRRVRDLGHRNLRWFGRGLQQVH